MWLHLQNHFIIIWANVKNTVCYIKRMESNTTLKPLQNLIWCNFCFASWLSFLLFSLPFPRNVFIQWIQSIERQKCSWDYSYQELAWCNLNKWEVWLWSFILLIFTSPDLFLINFSPNLLAPEMFQASDYHYLK